MIKKIALFTFVLILASCQNQTKKATENKIETGQTVEIKAIQDIVDQIDTNIADLTVVSSLFFQHNDESIEEVFAYLNDQQEIVKVEEKFKNGNSGNSGVRFFYFSNGKKIMSEERFIDEKNEKSEFCERVSFYNKNGKPFHTNQRFALYEEDLEKKKFSSVTPYDCSIETAENVLNQKGKFSTTFQGFVTNGPVDYLIVGGPGNSGYASALAIQYSDNVINYLKANEKRMINEPLIIEFEKVMDERKLEFQVLTGVQRNE